MIRRYFTDLWRIMIHPVRFFLEMPVKGGMSGPLAFALITHWLGSAVGYLSHGLWSSLFGNLFQVYWQSALQVANNYPQIDSLGRNANWMQWKDQLTQWLWSTGSVIADPFLTLLFIVVTTFFVYIGARILVTPGKNGAPTEITYESCLRFICYGMAPSILTAIPLVGSLASSILVAIVTIIGAREVFRVGSTRATIVALFPNFLFLGILFLGALAFLFTVVKFLATA